MMYVETRGPINYEEAIKAHDIPNKNPLLFSVLNSEVY